MRWPPVIRQVVDDWQALGKVQAQVEVQDREHVIAHSTPIVPPVAAARSWGMGELTDPRDVAGPGGG